MTDEDDAPERDPLDPFGAGTADEPDGDGVDARDDDRSTDDGDDRAGDRTVGPSDDWPTGNRTDAPLDDLASSVRDRREGTDASADASLFEEQDVTAIDADVVWNRVESDAEVPTTGSSDATERETRVVAKEDYCEQCPYFSPPPTVQCSHDGTEILELVDMEQFRVANCPKVHETDRLEDL